MRYLRNPVVIAWMCVVVLYWSVSWLFDPRKVIVFMDGIAIAFALSVMVLYGQRVRDGLAAIRPDVYDLLIVGIAGGWATNSLDRMWRMVSRVTGRPEMLDHRFIGATLISLAFFAAMHLLVRGGAGREGIHEGISPSAWGAIIVTLLLGAAIGTLALSLERLF